jgi:hypothetical protein
VARILRESLLAGAALALLWVALWTLAILAQQPEPPEFLEWVRQPPDAAAQTSNGMTSDLRACADCPSFILFRRGFGGDMPYTPFWLLTIWSYPALWLAGVRLHTLVIRELSPLVFFAALVAQWVLLGFGMRAAFWALSSYAHRGATSRRTRA